MNIRQKTSLKQLRSALLAHNFTVEDFSNRHGYNLSTVKNVIYRHWNRDTTPQGKIAKSILHDLETYFHKTPNYMKEAS